jgi:hypothetical protein
MARALLAALALVGTLAMVGAPSAAAQGGTGLYGPFPEPAGRGVSRGFYGDLIPTSVSAGALRRGVVLPQGRRLAAAGSGDLGASRRAGIAGHPDASAGWVVGAALAAAAAAGLAAVVLRRRPPEPR